MREPARGRARGGEKKLSRQEAPRGWQRWWCPLPRWVVVVRRDTVVERRHTKDTTVRRKRVVMGRESRGVLLLVALAVLAAADAFSTDSKFSHLRSDREAHFRSERGARGVEGGGVGERGRAWSRSLWLVYTQLQRSSAESAIRLVLISGGLPRYYS